MFGIVRIVLSGIIAVVIVYGCKVVSQNKHFVLFALIVLISTGLAFIPFENSLLTFDSPETSYEYYNFGYDATLVVSGAKSDLVIGKKGNSTVEMIVPKNKNGWKVGLGLNTKEIYRKITKDVSIHIYQYKNTNDYFVRAYNNDGKHVSITDEKNSRFIADGNNFMTYYWYLPNFDMQYSFFVDGEQIQIAGT